MLISCEIANYVCRFVAALAVGCAFGCARQAVYRQAMIYVFLEFNTGTMFHLSSDIAASASSAEYWHQFLAYWAPFVLLTSVEKIFITYADFQARLLLLLFFLRANSRLFVVYRYCTTSCRSCSWRRGCERSARASPPFSTGPNSYSSLSTLRTSPSPAFAPIGTCRPPAAILIRRQRSAPATRRRGKLCSKMPRISTPWPTNSRGCDASARVCCCCCRRRLRHAVTTYSQVSRSHPADIPLPRGHYNRLSGRRVHCIRIVLLAHGLRL